MSKFFSAKRNKISLKKQTDYMGNECSCSKTSILSCMEIKGNESAKEKKQEKQNECKSTKTKTTNLKESVKNSVDLDPCEEEDKTSIQRIKEVKVLPPIRNKASSVPHILYTPNRVWGGSVNSYLDTIQRDAIIDEDVIITGRQTYISGVPNEKCLEKCLIKCVVLFLRVHRIVHANFCTHILV